MFRIKICGITNIEDARAAAAAGADAIGLNFYPRSKRCIDRDTATTIAAHIPNTVKRIGVFVNASPEEIVEAAERVRLDAVQLHGDEPAAFLAKLPAGTPIIRAFRCGEPGLAPLRTFLQECRGLGRTPDAVLIDADAKQEYGGTGHVTDWSLVAREKSLLHAMPILLGGGLTPANVAVAIQTVLPEGVDVASGVETSPGKKDAKLIEQFVTAAIRAFNAAQIR
jgi:phosphoribosylanthranilate isomerase